MRSLMTVAVAVAALGLAAPTMAIAGANKTWVSGTGRDSGTCPITAPCASFQYAYGETAAGGEIDVKDSGGYGTLVIAKAISIVANGVAATISVPANGVGVTVQAAASDFVVISGVTIDGHLLGGDGIVLDSPAMVTNVDIRNLNEGLHAFHGIGAVRNSTFTKNITAIHLDEDATVSLDNNFLIDNTTSINIRSGSMPSYGNNSIINGGTFSGLTSATKY